MIWQTVKMCEPVVDRNVLCYCPDWNESGYQVAYWDGISFLYDEQPNKYFNKYVISWAMFSKAE